MRRDLDSYQFLHSALFPSQRLEISNIAASLRRFSFGSYKSGHAALVEGPKAEPRNATVQRPKLAKRGLHQLLANHPNSKMQ